MKLTINDLLTHLDKDALHAVCQSLYDEVLYTKDKKSKQLLELASKEYYENTGDKPVLVQR